MRRRWAAVPLSHRVIVVGVAVQALLVAINLLDRLADVDEVAQLHERIEGLSSGHWIVGALEPLAAIAILAFAVYALRRVRPSQRVLLVLAAAMLVAANASGALNDAGATTASSWGQHVLAAQEEVCEMLVGVFVLAATLPAVAEGLRRRYATPPVAHHSA